MSLLPRQYARCVWWGLILQISIQQQLYAQLLPQNESFLPSQPPAPLTETFVPFGNQVKVAPAVRTLSADASPTRGPIEISCKWASRFQDGEDTVLLLRGDCRIVQGSRTFLAPQAVLWDVSANRRGRGVMVYLEGTPQQQVQLFDGRGRESLPFLLLELTTTSEVTLTRATPVDVSEVDDPVYQRARGKRRAARVQLEQTQYVMAQVPPDLSPLRAPTRLQRHVTIGPRFLGERINARAEPSPYRTEPPEYLITITGGVNIVVDNVPLEVEGQLILTRIDLTADRAIVWTNDDRLAELGSFDIDENTPFQVYLEGNIVVRQGLNEVRASHAYYDVNQRRGLLINAEVRTFLSELEGTIRLRAAQVRQFSESSFHARDAWFTTSEFGHPKWRIQASDIYLNRRADPLSAPSGSPGGADNSLMWITSVNNQVFVEDLPILAVPYLSSPAEDPNIPLREFNVGYSGMFGWQIETQWNMEGLLGLDLPSGVNWYLDADFLSKRGPAVGTSGTYDLFAGFLGLPAHYTGFGDVYYINDGGNDNLGLGRRSLGPPGANRGRLLWRNRIDLPMDAFLIAEVGHVFNPDDRNFLEQYFETEWDTAKDLETRVILGQHADNLAATLSAGGLTYDFDNQTQWLPRGDLTVLGEPLWGSLLTWSSRSTIGYGRLIPADPPRDPLADPFAPLPWISESEGLVATTRHELDLPFHAGPVKVVPYLLGEADYWQEDITQRELTRLYGSAGVRASVTFSKYMPQVYDPILGLNGLAHKVTYDLDYYYAASTKDLSRVPQYNEFDDNAQERFRERYIPLEFGGLLPLQFDPRLYAVRAGVGRDITAPYYELVDDMQTLWLGMHHRWQTKVGPPDRPRIIDWAELSIRAGLFPQADRDNFGEDFGLVTGNFVWHVGPRTSLLSSAAFDMFDGGQQVWNVGVLSQRSTRGSIYLGYRQVEVGPIESKLVSTSYSYVLSPNLYVATFGGSYDVAEGRDRGESFTLTRIGEYFLLHFGLGYDRSRNNVGVAIALEPKFGSFGSGSMQLNSLLGIQ